MKSRAFDPSGGRTMGRFLSLILVTLGFCYACQEPTDVPFSRPLDPTNGESYTLDVVLLSEFSGRIEPREIINAAVCLDRSDDTLWPRLTDEKCKPVCKPVCNKEDCETECLASCTEEDVGCPQVCKTRCEEDCETECEHCIEEICQEVCRDPNSVHLKLGGEFASRNSEDKITIYPYQAHDQAHLKPITCKFVEVNTLCFDSEEYYVCDAALGGSTPLHALWEKYPNGTRVRVSNGDSTGRTTAMSSFFSDLPTVQNLNAIGLNYDTLGNHNFNNPLSYLQNIIDKSSYRFISATLENVPQNISNLAPYAILTIPADKKDETPLHVAVIGALDSTVMGIIHSGKFGSLTISNHCAVKLALQDAYHKNVRAFIIVAHFTSEPAHTLLKSLFGLIKTKKEDSDQCHEPKKEPASCKGKCHEPIKDTSDPCYVPCRDTCYGKCHEARKDESDPCYVPCSDICYDINLPIPEDRLIAYYNSKYDAKIDSVRQLPPEVARDELIEKVNTEINREIFEGILAVFGEASNSSLIQAFVANMGDALPNICDDNTFQEPEYNFLLNNPDTDDNGSWLNALKIVQPNAERFVGEVKLYSTKDVLWFVQTPGNGALTSNFSFDIRRSDDDLCKMIDDDDDLCKSVSKAYHAVLRDYHLTSVVSGYTPITPTQCGEVLRMLDDMPACKEFYEKAVLYIDKHQGDRAERDAILTHLSINACVAEIANAISRNQIQPAKVFDIWSCVYRASTHLTCGDSGALKEFNVTEVFIFPTVTQMGNLPYIYFPKTDDELRTGSSFVTGLFGDIFYVFAKILERSVDIVLMNAGMYGTGSYYRVLEKLRMGEYINFENNLVTFSMSPRRFADYFEHGLGGENSASGAFPAFSGIHISYKTNIEHKKEGKCPVQGKPQKPERIKRVYEMFKVDVDGEIIAPIYVFLGTQRNPIKEYDSNTLVLKGCDIESLSSTACEKTGHTFAGYPMQLETFEEEFYLTSSQYQTLKIMTNNFIVGNRDGYVDNWEGSCDTLKTEPLTPESVETTYSAVNKYLFEEIRTCDELQDSEFKTSDNKDRNCVLARAIVKRHYDLDVPGVDLISTILTKEDSYPRCIFNGTVDGTIIDIIDGDCPDIKTLCETTTNK